SDPARRAAELGNDRIIGGYAGGVDRVADRERSACAGGDGPRRAGDRPGELGPRLRVAIDRRLADRDIVERLENRVVEIDFVGYRAVVAHRLRMALRGADDEVLDVIVLKGDAAAAAIGNLAVRDGDERVILHGDAGALGGEGQISAGRRGTARGKAL